MSPRSMAAQLSSPSWNGVTEARQEDAEERRRSRCEPDRDRVALHDPVVVERPPSDARRRDGPARDTAQPGADGGGAE